MGSPGYPRPDVVPPYDKVPGHGSGESRLTSLPPRSSGWGDAPMPSYDKVLGDTLTGLVVSAGRPARRTVEDVALDQLVHRHTRRRHRPAALDLGDELRQLAVRPGLAPPVVGRVDRRVQRLPLAANRVSGVDGEPPGAGLEPLVTPHEQRARARWLA
jgi:hypothetical protein